jgi:hypothetical protein
MILILRILSKVLSVACLQLLLVDSVFLFYHEELEGKNMKIMKENKREKKRKELKKRKEKKNS